MEIILMRHGKPSFIGNSKVTSREMTDWITQYNLSEIGRDTPPESSVALAFSALCVISSPLPRAISSLNALGCHTGLTDDIFREADLPVYCIPGMRLYPAHWAILFRIMWFCGMFREVGSLAMAKRRARQAADILIDLVHKNNGPVLLMGHGIMNRLIARALMSKGWKEHRRAGNAYWNAGVYHIE
ncbi:histidine phosphatase family protein [Klebsiella sp. R390]|uniref:histidine phosphatase family protein n=1 Tax=Klebsiella sp. R390 TaxID=2755400 RepID=UPI003DA92A13